MNLRVAIALLCIWLLAACGGGGGGDSTSISVSPASLHFTGYSDGAASAAKIVTANFKGDGVVVGFAPGVSPPEWLSIESAGTSGSSATFRLAVNPYLMALGSYSTQVRFVTGHTDGSDVKFQDVSVDMQVLRGMQVPASVTITEVDGAPIGAPEQPVSIQGDDLEWVVSTEADFLSVSPTSGVGEGEFRLKAVRGDRALGNYYGTVVVRDAPTGRIANVAVTYQIVPNELVVTPERLDWHIGELTAAAELTADVRVSDLVDGGSNAKGFDWVLTGVPDWASVSSLSGNSSTPQQLTVTLDKAKVERLPPGERVAYLRIDPAPGSNYFDTRYIPLNFDITLPLVRSIDPPVLTPGLQNEVVLRGDRLDLLSITDLRIGGQPVSLLERIDNSALRLRLPALPAGRHSAVYAGSGIFIRAYASAVAQSLSAPPELSLSSPGAKYRIVLDELHRRVFLVDRNNSRIEVYAVVDGVWSALDPITLNDITDATLSWDRRSLYIAACGSVYGLDLDAGATMPTLVASTDAPSCENVYQQLGTLNTGVLLAPRLLDLLSGEYLGDGLGGYGGFYSARGYSRFVTAAGGNAAFGGEVGLNPPTMGSYVVQADLARFRWSGNGYRIDVAGNGTKAMFGETLLDVELNELGSVAYFRAAALSADGNTLFAYVHPSEGVPAVEVYDITDRPGTGEVYPLLRTIPLADNPGDPPDELYYISSEPKLRMVLSSDDKTLYLTGTERLLILPTGE